MPALIDWMEGWEKRARGRIGRQREYKRGRERDSVADKKEM